MPIDRIVGSRSRILAYSCVAIMAVFIVRLFYLQVINHDTYVELARKEQVKPFILKANRGEIYALDDGKPVKMVLNETVYTTFVDPKIAKEPAKIVKAIRDIAGGNARPNLDALVRKKDSRYQIVATEVTRKQAEMLRAKHLVGLGFQATSRRVYPEGQLAAQTLGFVNTEGKGQYGVEGYLDDRLQGKDGLLKTVTDIANVPLTIGKDSIKIPAKNGDNIVLSIDRNIQSYTEQALADGLQRSGAQQGSVLVMDPRDGTVLAMANLPTFKPSEYGKVTDANAFRNAVVSDPYEPGSVMKTFTVAMGINEGIITPESTYNNTDYITVDDRTISNATKGQTGTITIQHALNYSLNTGMVTVAQRLGDGSTINRKARDTMYHYLHDKFKLGELTGLEVSGEAPGILIAPDSGEGNAVRYSNMSFGQGMNLSMIQVASGFSAIVNGGNYYKPSVIAGTMSTAGDFASAPKRSGTRILSQTTSAAATKMVHDARAAFYTTIDKPGYYVGGKTGTSQTLDAKGNYTDEQTTASYLGFGGDDTPKYVIMVEVSGAHLNLQGNKHAMPIFTDISNWLIDYLKLQPKG